MLLKKKPILAKNNKITRTYKNLSNEINPVSLRARFNLQQINLFLRKKVAEMEKELYLKRNNNKNRSVNEVDQNSSRDNKENNDNINISNQQKENSFFFPSHSKFKLIKEYQKYQKEHMLKEKGFKNYISRIKSSHKFIQNIKKAIPDKSSSLYDFYTIPKIPKKNQLPKKRDISSASHLYYKSENKFRKIPKINKEKENKKKMKRTMSAQRINWFEKDKEWKRKNKFINEEDYNFFLDRPITPLTLDKSVKALPYGGGVLHCNSIWRFKKINDLIPDNKLKPLKKINDYKKKRDEIIYKKKKSISHDFTFLSNRLIVDDKFFIYHYFIKINLIGHFNIYIQKNKI